MTKNRLSASGSLKERLAAIDYKFRLWPERSIDYKFRLWRKASYDYTFQAWGNGLKLGTIDSPPCLE